MRLSKILVASTVLLGLVLPATAEWPERPVRIVVPYGPGGGVDGFARPIAARLQEELGQPFVIDNRAGAGGTIGVLNAARSEPDGYTLLSGGVHQPMAEALYPRRGYRIDVDFVPIGITAVVPNVLVVNPQAGLTDLRDLMARLRAAPDSLTYCSSGNGTSQHVIAEMFLRETGLRMTHVPYRSTAPAMNDLLAGTCPMMFDGMGTSAAQIAGGRLRALALTVGHRSTLFPEIPTMAEAGGPAMEAGTWYALWAPAATPAPIITRLRAALRRALTSPEVARIWRQQGAEVGAVPDDRLKAYVREETARWSGLVTVLGLTAD
ncbi:tripartite tricarboxylate transporter substrate binding protein [Roseomonas hellenica]|uniref:Tripartite tricarboxylate transporter substrate binding protein n=1 Tax=Plastoroseomonas hellenica TaxID=2687306 RepID=A0ABS5EY26_9PROT|nr:tripartite tricarboxylate transporter substrate-binding protein [Plastoroseomonas hellenica]MBR0665208.1 tripartite tricarboxylate transporter substrate binding protein [Plastoroseomonas hellenica]